MVTSEFNSVVSEIDILRDRLEDLIKEKHGNLLDSEVVNVSKKLNVALNRYDRMGDKKEY